MATGPTAAPAPPDAGAGMAGDMAGVAEGMSGGASEPGTVPGVTRLSPPLAEALGRALSTAAARAAGLMEEGAATALAPRGPRGWAAALSAATGSGPAPLGLPLHPRGAPLRPIGPEPPPEGLMLLCPGLIDALIEMQVLGDRLTPRPALRPPTEVDRALTEGFAARLLDALPWEALGQTPLRAGLRALPAAEIALRLAPGQWEGLCLRLGPAPAVPDNPAPETPATGTHRPGLPESGLHESRMPESGLPEPDAPALLLLLPAPAPARPPDTPGIPGLSGPGPAAFDAAPVAPPRADPGSGHESGPTADRAPEAPADTAATLAATLAGSVLPVVARLALRRICLADLAGLRPGTLLPLPGARLEEVTLLPAAGPAPGRSAPPLATAQLGRTGEMRALRLRAGEGASPPPALTPAPPLAAPPSAVAPMAVPAPTPEAEAAPPSPTLAAPPTTAPP